MNKKDMIMSDGADRCISAIAGTSADNAAFTIGDPFMLVLLVVFDVGAGQMKFRSR
jgi:hypothetical protein